MLNNKKSLRAAILFNQRPFYLVSFRFMFLVAFLTVYRSVAGWHEGYFSLLTTVCTNCFVHLSWSSETASPFAEAASSFVAHVLITLVWFFSARVAIAIPHVPLDLDRDLVSDLCAGHRNHNASDA